MLGHSAGELRRLEVQAALVDPMTRSFLAAGGIGPGQRVLDVGSGGGHVAFVAAELVGPNGSVVGVDKAQGAVDAANAEAAHRRLTQVSFRQGDPTRLPEDQPFDAVIGRYVLQFQAEPAAFLAALLPVVRRGGPVVFHELDWGGLRSFPPSALHDQACLWAEEAIRRSGAKTDMGRRLRATFVEAGLPEPTLRMEAVIGGGDNSVMPLEQVAGLVQTLLPSIERLGIATADEVGADSLLARMRQEADELGSVIIGRMQVGCWSTCP
ncbi:hypothetical protein acdb102_49530 [Acidothermaceae bacterium B102]|nr:hypothetical protein acdb102_49530 [Acidothermaceae bacterium B102]